MSLNRKRFARFRNSATGALILASVAMLSSAVAMAATYDSGVVNIAVPATLDGVYFNLITQGQATTPFAGWDMDPFAFNGTGNLGIYWNAAAVGGLSAGAVASAASPTQYALLPLGTWIGPSSTFSHTIAGPAPNFTAGVTAGYLGVRFVNEATGQINYGWVQLTTTAPTGFPATIVRYSYENTGQPIVAGGDEIFSNGFDGGT